MKNLPSLLKPQFRGSRPIPLYSKLSFHNKILLIVLALLMVFGLLGAVALHWILNIHLSKEYENHFKAITASLSHRLGPMVLSGDNDAVTRLLSEENQLHESIAYLIVTDNNGNLLSQAFDEAFSKKRQTDGFDSYGGNEVKHQKSITSDNTVMEVASPIVYEEQSIGILKSGISTSSMDAFTSKIMTLYLGILVVIIFISLLIAKPFLRYTTSSIATLTRIADEISLGNLDMDIFFGQHVNCWEIKECGRKDCAAYTQKATQCWFVDGTPCEGYEPKFPEKLQGCRKCEVYKTHKGDEIVQLADSFQHMIYMLKASQAELEDSHKFQSNLLQNSLVGIIATNEVGIVKIFNRVAESLTGYDNSETVDKLTLNDFFSEDISIKIDRPLMFDYGITLRGFKPMEAEIFKKTKEPIPVKLSGINLYEENKHLGTVFSFQDMREVKRLRQELVQSERLAATGQAVASISHSIKNILDGLVGGAHVYRRGKRAQDEKRTQKGWRMIEKNIDLISELVSNLLNYAKERKPIFHKCDPRDIVKDVIGTMESKISDSKTNVVSEFKGSFENVYLDSYALHQCLMNLLSNAIDAIPPERPGHITVRVESKNEHGVIFEVSDNGVGLSEEIRDKAFHGMFSTKGSKGTGLGLLVINKIVSEHEGTVDVSSETDKGATFKIWLPQHEPNTAAFCPE